MVALEKGECIIREVRKHWFFVAVKAITFLIIALLPALLYPMVVNFLVSHVHVATNPVTLFFAVYPLWVLILWILFFLFWTDYYLDVLIITNQRIMNVNQKGMFNREISTLRFENIQDIKIDVAGLLATFFDFGNVQIQTAAESIEFVIKMAAKPEEVKRIISDKHDEAVRALKDTPITV